MTLYVTELVRFYMPGDDSGTDGSNLTGAHQMGSWSNQSTDDAAGESSIRKVLRVFGFRCFDSFVVRRFE
jgi:hypothetical protein